MKNTIVHIIPTLGFGGAEKLVTEISRELSKTRAVHVIVIFESDEELKISENLNLKLTKLGIKKKDKLKAAAKLNIALGMLRPNVMHTHLSAIVYSLPWAIFGRFFNLKKSFHTVHNMAEHDSPGIIRIIYKILFKLHITLPIAISANVKKSIHEHIGINDCLVINNGVASSKKTEGYSDVAKNTRDFMLRSEVQIILLCIARINRQKNLELLIEVAKYFKNIGFCIIGQKDASDINYSNGLIEKFGGVRNIYYAGAVDNVGDYIAICDALILTSHYEGLPMAIIESMSVGKIIISTPVGGVPEAITNFGYLASSVTKKDVCDAIKLFLNEMPDEINRRKDISREIYENNYSIKICAKHHDDIY